MCLAYDLATQCPTRRASVKKYTSDNSDRIGNNSYSRPHSRQSDTNTTNSISPSSEELANLGSTIPEMSWSRTSLQEDLFQSVTYHTHPPHTTHHLV